MFGHGTRQLFHIGDGHGTFVIARHIVANPDGQQFNLFALFDHGDDVAQVFFQVIGRVHRQGAVIHWRAVRDHHQNFTHFGTSHHPPVRPFQRLTIDVFLEQTFFHHQAQIWPCATPRGIRRFIDDVAQIIQATGLLRAAFVQPLLAGLPTFPRAGGKAEDFHLNVTTLKRARQNIGTDRRNGYRAAPHRAGIVQQQGHNRVAKFGVFFDLEGQRRCRVGHHTCQTARVQNAFFQIKFPRAVLLRL